MSDYELEADLAELDIDEDPGFDDAGGVAHDDFGDDGSDDNEVSDKADAADDVSESVDTAPFYASLPAGFPPLQDLRQDVVSSWLLACFRARKAIGPTAFRAVIELFAANVRLIPRRLRFELFMELRGNYGDSFPFHGPWPEPGSQVAEDYWIWNPIGMALWEIPSYRSICILIENITDKRPERVQRRKRRRRHGR